MVSKGLIAAGALVVVLPLALFKALKQPGASETVVRKIVKLGGIPDAVFDDIEVFDESVWFDILTQGNLGLAEGYMHGKINIDVLKVVRLLLNDTNVGTRRKEGSDVMTMFANVVSAPDQIMAYISNQQNRQRSMRVIDQHYNSGNEVYEGILGPTMGYTCGYWKNAKTLDEAQIAKFHLVRRKLQLQPGMKVADLGMGWGFAADLVSRTDDVSVTGVTLAKEQLEFAKARNPERPGLRYVLRDYRDHCLDKNEIGTYDAVYSIGMLEHVGYQNHAGFFECVKKLLKPSGLAVIQTIGEPDFVPIMDPFLDKYIFPGAVIPSLSSLTSAFENHFVLEDFQNFGYDYALTLEAWNEKAEVFFKEHPGKYSVAFQRMWEYYLKMCQVLFELRLNQLWHFVLSPRPTLRKGIERQL